MTVGAVAFATVVVPPVVTVPLWRYVRPVDTVPAMFGSTAVLARLTGAVSISITARADANSGERAKPIAMAWSSETTSGMSAAGTPRLTPGTGVPYAGYGNVSGWLAGGRLEIGDGIASGAAVTAGSGEAAGTGADAAGAAGFVVCALAGTVPHEKAVKAKSARLASVRDAISSFKLLLGRSRHCAFLW